MISGLGQWCSALKYDFQK